MSKALMEKLQRFLMVINPMAERIPVPPNMAAFTRTGTIPCPPAQYLRHRKRTKAAQIKRQGK